MTEAESHSEWCGGGILPLLHAPCTFLPLPQKDVFSSLIFLETEETQSKTLFRSHLDEFPFSFSVILLLIRSIAGFSLLPVSRFSTSFIFLFEYVEFWKSNYTQRCEVSLISLFPPCITTSFTLWEPIPLVLVCLSHVYICKDKQMDIYICTFSSSHFFLTQKVASFLFYFFT